MSFYTNDWNTSGDEAKFKHYLSQAHRNGFSQVQVVEGLEASEETLIITRKHPRPDEFKTIRNHLEQQDKKNKLRLRLAQKLAQKHAK